MSEKEKPLGEVPIAEMTADQFFAMAIQVFEAHNKLKESQGSTKLLNMNITEFSEQMVMALKGRAMKTAISEAEIAQRILADWEGLVGVEAVSQPARLKSKDDLEKFVTDLKGSFDGLGGELVVAVAVCTGENMYQKLR